jgi:protein-tyrosine-phosphatase
MGCGDDCPFIRAKQHVDWDIPDPQGRSIEDVRRIRDLIRDQVQELLKNSK